MQRVVAILESVAESQGPTTPVRVSGETALSLSTVSRLMRELAEEQLLDRSPDGTYTLGSRVFLLVRKATESADPVASIQSVLVQLRDATGETVSVHVRRGSSRVCIASANSLHELRRVVPIGDAIPLIGTATGEVLLSSAEPADLDAECDAAGLSATERDALLQRLRRTAEQGWAMSSESRIQGVTGVSAAVYVGRAVVAAITVSGPTTRFTPERAAACVPELHKAALKISAWMPSS
jgi:DNA-binding IclR family transcriptional regulator